MKINCVWSNNAQGHVGIVTADDDTILLITELAFLFSEGTHKDYYSHKRVSAKSEEDVITYTKNLIITIAKNLQTQQEKTHEPL
jgi:hypothetical protein